MKTLKLIFKNKPYLAIVWVFCSLNIMIGSWVLYIPQVKSNLNLSDSEIGFALFCAGLGLLSFLSFAPKLTQKFGLGKFTYYAICLFSVAYILPIIATSYVFLCIGLFVVGVFSGLTDVAMNAVVSELEKSDQVSFMSAAHGFFSVGGAIGAGIGTLMMIIIDFPVAHMAIMACVVIISNTILFKYYASVEEKALESTKNRLSMQSITPLIPLALIALIIMANEGAVEHWSTLYLSEVVNGPVENLSGSGFVLFSTMMALGRFSGDNISERIGSFKLIIFGSLLAIMGYGIVLTNVLIITVIGFGVIGLGLSVIIPEVIRVAGKTKEVSATKSIAFVTGVGFFGFLGGPVIIGYISDATSLFVSFFILLCLTGIATFCAYFYSRK